MGNLTGIFRQGIHRSGIFLNRFVDAVTVVLRSVNGLQRFYGVFIKIRSGVSSGFIQLALEYIFLRLSDLPLFALGFHLRGFHRLTALVDPHGSDALRNLIIESGSAASGCENQNNKKQKAAPCRPASCITALSISRKRTPAFHNVSPSSRSLP